MTEQIIAILQCRQCLQDWETKAERVSYELEKGTGEMGSFLNYENPICPECGNESYWEITP